MRNKDELKLAFLGDVSFNNGYTSSDLGGNVFSDVVPLLESCDLTVFNLESPIAVGAGRDKNPLLSTTRNALGLLSTIPVNLACLANNHILDFHSAGFQATVDTLDELGIAHTGATLDSHKLGNHFIWQKDWLCMSLLNYVTTDTNPGVTNEEDCHINIFDLATAEQDIQEARTEANFIAVVLHWGGLVDYGYFPHHQQLTIVRKLIKAGADLIVGHHSHTLQPRKRIQGKMVYFSLGNFCFADLKRNDKVMPLRRSGRIGGVVLASISKSLIYRTTLCVVKNHNLRIQPSRHVPLSFKFRQVVFPIAMMPGIRSLYYWYLQKVDRFIRATRLAGKRPLREVCRIILRKLRLAR